MNSDEMGLAGRRILVAAEYIGSGGTRTYFKQLLEFYARNGAHVVAVTSYSNPDPEMYEFVKLLGFELITFEDLTEETGVPGMAKRPTVWSKGSSSLELDAFNSLVRSRNIDQVVLSVGTSGLFLSAAATRTKLNPVMVAHGYPHGLRQKLFGRRILVRSLPADITLVVVSDYSQRVFRAAWAGRRDISVETVRSSCGAIANFVPLSAREHLVLCAALLEDYKQPIDWVETAEKVIRDFSSSHGPEFIWIGEGPLRSEVERRISASGVTGISFPGWQSDVGPFYDRARVYLQLSSKESLGLSAVDALRHGIPAVVSDAGGLPEVVLDGVNGFVVPVGDTAAAASAVSRLLTDDKLWEEQSAAARRLYLERFSPEAWEAGLLSAHN